MSSWNYKQYAARRTLICKRISGGRISPGKVYFVHVTGGSQLGTAISERLSYKEQPLGCEVVIDKNGAAAANYWPKL